MAQLYIIAGCNGAGKTTASYTVLPDILHCKEFVNADEIAKGLSPFQPERVSIQAGRIMLNRIHELIESKTDFAFETTLTTLSYQQTIQHAKASGYIVTLIFFWLNDVNLAIERVKLRVSEGGHNIPQVTIRRRYKKGLQNLVSIFTHVCDNWMIIDNSNEKHNTIAEKFGKNKIIIHDKVLWNKIKTENEKEN